MVNQQKSRHWPLENRRELHRKPLHQLKVIVWCAIGKTAVIGPYFFDKNNRNAVALDSERYTVTNSLCLNFNENACLSYVCGFGDRLVSMFTYTPWYTWSSDLSIGDYFLWGYLKEHVHDRKPRTLDNLKETILIDVTQIGRVMLEGVDANF